MTIKLLYIQEENLELELTAQLGILVKDLEHGCEIEISPEITAKLLAYTNVIIAGFMKAQKDGLIEERFGPDWT